ncbi:MAG: uncharacterized SAM-binding protein YcdF (DUF218 family) [Flavobacteriales bacterium]|jgi:uncharacterized SAM-binding protein YcdF (DUF218 family)
MEKSIRQKSRSSKLIRWGVRIAILAFVLFLFRGPILRGLGNFLSPEDELEHVEALFVLGGNSLDRGNEAAILFHANWTDRLICSGGNIPTVLSALDIPLYEHQITRQLLINAGIDSTKVEVLTTATSTWEEAQEIVEYCQTHKIKKAMVLSSKFHLRRVRRVFSKAFEESDTQLLFHGAPSSDYDESEWWKSEGGLIMLNNEYVKLFYYFIKY